MAMISASARVAIAFGTNLSVYARSSALGQSDGIRSPGAAELLSTNVKINAAAWGQSTVWDHHSTRGPKKIIFFVDDMKAGAGVVHHNFRNAP